MNQLDKIWLNAIIFDKMIIKDVFVKQIKSRNDFVCNFKKTEKREKLSKR